MLRVFVLVNLFLLFVTTKAQLNISLVGQLSFFGNGEVSDIWGYVDTSGREYALVGLEMGTSIVDISTPSVPAQVFFSQGDNTTWRDLKVWNKHAYIVNEGGSGLKIIDMSNLPGTITTNDVYQYTGSNYPFTTSHDLYIDENGIAFIFGANYDVGGAIILDLNVDPKNPIELGLYSDYYLHDGMVRGDTLWAAAVENGFFAVIDVTNKAAPVTMATQNTPSFVSHNCWISDDGNTLFTTDEVGGAFITSYDVSNLSNITELDRVQSSPGQGVVPHNTFFINDYLVTSYYRDGVVIHDVSNPSNMIEVGNYDTSPAYSGSGGNGAWGVYPYLPSGLIIASDIENGLFVLGPTYNRACYLIGNVTDSVTGSPLDNVQIQIVSTSTSTNTNVLGDYQTGIATSATYDITFSRFAYEVKTIVGVTLNSGLTTTLNAELVPFVPFTLQGKVIDSITTNPVSGAQINISRPNIDITVQTDVNGNFSVPNFIEGNYDVTIGKWGYDQRCLTDQYLSPNGNVHNYSLYPGYYDDFTFDLGWNVTGNSNGGVWERGVPIATFFLGAPANPWSDSQSDCSNKAYVTGNAGGGASTDDVDAGETILTSPIFDLSNYIDPYVNFERWFFNVGLSLPVNDSMFVDLSNGTNTARVDFSDFNDSTMSSWSSKSIRVSDFLTPTSAMQLTVRVMDLSPDHIVEGGIDKFQVTDSIGVNIANATVHNEVNVLVYPNPFNDILNVKSKDFYKVLRVRLYDVLGKFLWERKSTSTSELRFLNNLEKGVYFIHTYGDNKLIDAQRIVKF